MRIVIDVNEYEGEYMATSSNFDGLSTFGETIEESIKEFAIAMEQYMDVLIEDGETLEE